MQEVWSFSTVYMESFVTMKNKLLFLHGFSHIPLVFFLESVFLKVSMCSIDNFFVLRLKCNLIKKIEFVSDHIVIILCMCLMIKARLFFFFLSSR